LAITRFVTQAPKRPAKVVGVVPLEGNSSQEEFAIALYFRDDKKRNEKELTPWQT
jgi:hypothetical protein